MPTPILLRPIEYSADIVVHSLTKFLGGTGQMALTGGPLPTEEDLFEGVELLWTLLKNVIAV